MKEYRIKISTTNDIHYYYSSSKSLTEEEKEEKQKIENQVCNSINITEIGARNAICSVSVKKEDNCIIVIVKADDIEITEESN